MYECSGEMRYWENHYNQVQAGIKLKEAETTFQNITLGGYLGWNFLLRFSLSGHSIIRSNVRYVKVNWNQGGFFRVDKNPGFQSQDQMIASLPSFRLEDSVVHWVLDIISVACWHTPYSVGRMGIIWVMADTAKMSHYLSWTEPQTPRSLLLYKLFQETHPSAVWVPFLKEQSKSFKGSDLWHLKLGSSNDFG